MLFYISIFYCSSKTNDQTQVLQRMLVLSVFCVTNTYVILGNYALVHIHYQSHIPRDRMVVGFTVSREKCLI